MIKAKLTYFKPTGKYYSDGEIDIFDCDSIFEAIGRIRNMLDIENNWPGLVYSKEEYQFHVHLKLIHGVHSLTHLFLYKDKK